jgi:hypothetical protein
MLSHTQKSSNKLVKMLHPLIYLNYLVVWFTSLDAAEAHGFASVPPLFFI